MEAFDVGGYPLCYNIGVEGAGAVVVVEGISLEAKPLEI